MCCQTIARGAAPAAAQPEPVTHRYAARGVMAAVPPALWSERQDTQGVGTKATPTCCTRTLMKRGAHAQRPACVSPRPRAPIPTACGEGGKRCWAHLPRSLTVWKRRARASKMSRRWLSTWPTPAASLMASSACRVPMTPGTTPSTPASEQRAQLAAWGLAGNRQR